MPEFREDNAVFLRIFVCAIRDRLQNEVISVCELHSQIENVSSIQNRSVLLWYCVNKTLISRISNLTRNENSITISIVAFVIKSNE